MKAPMPNRVHCFRVGRASLLIAGLLLTAARLGAGEEALPAPTGSHKTGRISFHWIDRAREELETKEAGDPRELMVHLFYPADPNATGERAIYVPDAEAMQGPWNKETLARIQAIRAYSIESAAVAPGETMLPVLIFSPGGGMKGLIYHVFCEDLASHGWVVAAIDPPYNAKAVRLPDGRVLGGLPEDKRGWPEARNPEQGKQYYIERIAHWSRDISFVIDQLQSLHDGDGPFAGRLDLSRGVGACGHSRGGQAAGSVRIIDQRIRAGVNIDGTTPFAVIPIAGEGRYGETPYLWIQGPEPKPPSEEQLRKRQRTRADYDRQVAEVIGAWHSHLETISSGAIRLCINRQEVDHIDFSDEHFWDGTLNQGSREETLRTIAETRRWLLAFFQATMLDQRQALAELVDGAKAGDAGLAPRVFGTGLLP